MKFINKKPNIPNSLSDEAKYNIIYVLIVIFSVLFIIQKGISVSLKYSIILSLLFVLAEIILYIFLKKKKNKLPLHKTYLIFAIILGVFYIMVFPPGQIPDECSDYLRSLEVSDFHLTSVKEGSTVGRTYSKNITEVINEQNDYDDYKNNFFEKLSNEKTFQFFANKSLYAFVCYIPQAIGIGFGKIVGLSITMQMILGKICNYVLFVLLMFFSIKYIPFKKYLLFVIALLPITMQEATSLSPDCMTIGLSIAFVSFIVWACNTKKEFTAKHYLFLIVSSICLSLCKIVYMPICFLALLIPKECFKTNKKKLIYITSLIIIVIIINLIWLKISSSYLVAFSFKSNSEEQLKYIMNHPLKYLFILGNTFEANLSYYLLQISGKSLGTFSVSTSYTLSLIILLLVYSLIKEKNEKETIYNLYEKTFILLIVIGVVILIATSLYLQWTSLRLDHIEGIQGRYFIPLLLPIAMLFMTKKEKKKDNNYIKAYMFSVNILAIAIIFLTYMK